MKASQQKQQATPLRLFLRIKHPHIDPADLTRELAMVPEHTIQAGPAMSRSGVRRLHSESYWLAELKLSAFVVSEQTMEDYRSLLTTASAERLREVRQRLFAQGPALPPYYSKSEAIEMIGAPPLEVVIRSWLRKLVEHKALFESINAEGGSVSIIAQLQKMEYPIRIRPAFARRLAELGVELEVAAG